MTSQHDEMVFIDSRIEGGTNRVEAFRRGDDLFGHFWRHVLDATFDRRVGDVYVAVVRGAVDYILSLLVSLFDNFVSEGSVFCFSVECELILRLSIRHFVDSKPFHRRRHEPGHEFFDITDVV